MHFDRLFADRNGALLQDEQTTRPGPRRENAFASLIRGDRQVTQSPLERRSVGNQGHAIELAAANTGLRGGFHKESPAITQAGLRYPGSS